MQQNSKLVRCPICESVNIDTGDEIYCRRCKQKIYDKPYKSFHRSLAFLLTAIILYLPANLYPILITKKLSVVSENTILSGIVVLWEDGSYPIAIIILFASVFVPILKFLALIYLLLSTKFKLHSSKIDKHKLFYIIEAIGSWSMIDVFVVAILATLIHFAGVQIYTGIGAMAFAFMVLFTMFSALSFDSRMILKDEMD